MSTVLKILLALLLLAGCGRKAVMQRFYVLETEESAAPTHEPLTDAACEILPLKIQPAFASLRIAARTRSHEVNYYVHHKWAVKPDQMLSDMAERFLQKQRIFGTISSRVLEVIPAYELQIEVKQLEAILDEAEDLSAHMNLEMLLIENPSKNTVVRHAADRQVPLEENDLNLFARTISELFHSELETFADKVKAFLEQRLETKAVNE